MPSSTAGPTLAGNPEAVEREIESFDRLLASYRRLLPHIEDETGAPAPGARVPVRRVDLTQFRWSMATCEIELRRLHRQRLRVVPGGGREGTAPAVGSAGRAGASDDQGGLPT